MLDVNKALHRLDDPKNRSYKRLFEMGAEHYKNVNAAEWLEDGVVKSYTYGEQEKLTYATAAKLRAALAGVPKGYVGIRLENSPMWCICFWSLLMCGYNAVLIPSNAETEAAAHIMRQVDGHAILTDSPLEVPDVKVIQVQPLLDVNARADGFDTDWANECALCTSGTTANAKVFVYDGEAMARQLWGAVGVPEANYDLVGDYKIKILVFLPMNHIFGLAAIYLWFLLYGKTMVYLKDRAPETIMNTCRTCKVTHMFAVPLFWNSIAQGIMRKAKMSGMDEKLNKGIDMSLKLQGKLGAKGRALASKLLFKDTQNALAGTSIRFCISGGGHLPEDTLRVLNGIGYHLANGYGMTETGVNSIEMTYDMDKLLKGSVGMPLQRIEYSIDDSKGYRELKVRGAAMHNGRMIDGRFIPRDTSDDGWFYTGDIASQDEDGHFYIEGRAKEVIINASGENIYPDEMEDAFRGMTDIDSYCVTGVSNDTEYEDITLVAHFATPEISDKQIKQFAEEVNLANLMLPLYKKLGRVLVSKDALPLANGIKVRRQKLRAEIESGERECLDIDIKNKCVKNSVAKPQAVSANGAAIDCSGPEFEAIKEQVRGLFADVLSLTPDEISDTAHFIDDLGGDSLSSLGMFTKAEEIYNLVIPDTEYYGAATVEDCAKLLYSKLHGVSAVAAAESAPADLRRITKFEDSREYVEFMARWSMLKEAAGGDPYFVSHDSALTDVAIVDGREVLNMGSYNYVGLSVHPEVVAAAKAAAEKYGTSASGSRLLAGEKPLHRELELAIAKWKHTEDSIVLVGGHSTNVTFVGNFCNERDLILYDALSHNSITQGCTLSKSDSKAFPHNDLDALEYMLKSSRDKYEKILVVVEGVYSMDGDIAPIPQFVALKKKYGAFLMVDEAHSSCAIGEHGGGVDDYFGLAGDDIDIKMGTLSKGLGTCGGYLAGSKALITYLRYNVPGFVFSVGLSPVLAAATLRSVEIMLRGYDAVGKLHDNIKYMIDGAKRRGLNTCLAGESAIIPIIIGRDEDAFRVTVEMLKRGVDVPPAVFPAVPKGQARLRFSLTSLHKPEQIDYALDTLVALMDEIGISK